jgi:hypothetical protein
MSCGRKHDRYITELNENDVLLGKGFPIINNPGNVKYRELILANKEKYISTSRHAMKDEIARSIFDTIAERGGRFLRRAESCPSKKAAGTPMDAWEIVDEETSMHKIKQALRDQPTSIKHRASPSHSRSPSSSQTEPASYNSDSSRASRKRNRQSTKVKDAFASTNQTSLKSAFDDEGKSKKKCQSTKAMPQTVAEDSPPSLDGPNLLVKLKHPSLPRHKLLCMRKRSSGDDNTEMFGADGSVVPKVLADDSRKKPKSPTTTTSRSMQLRTSSLTAALLKSAKSISGRASGEIDNALVSKQQVTATVSNLPKTESLSDTEEDKKPKARQI